MYLSVSRKKASVFAKESEAASVIGPFDTATERDKFRSMYEENVSSDGEVLTLTNIDHCPSDWVAVQPQCFKWFKKS
jgi:hypothetical protein